MTSEYTAINILLKDSNGNYVIPYTEKQDPLTQAQLDAVNSGVTGSKVSGYDTHLTDTTKHITAAERTAWSNKQGALSEAQLNATNSGITSDKVTKYDSYEATINGKATKATTLSGYGITDAYTKTEVDGLVSSVYKYKGSVESIEALPKTGQKTGDVYNTEDTGMNYAWTGTEWDPLGSIIDLSDYAKKEDIPNVTDTYSATSSDAMSGKAVANALSTVKVSSATTADTATTSQSCSGNAATATKATQDGEGNEIASFYQQKLVQGDNIIIEGNVISAKGGGGSSVEYDESTETLIFS